MSYVNLGWFSEADRVANKVIDTNIALQDQEYILRNIVTTQGAYYELLDKSGKKISETGYMNIGALNQFNPQTWAANAAVSGQNLWDVWGSDMQEASWFSENEQMVENAGQKLGFALYAGMGVALQTGDPQLQQSMETVLKGIAEPGSVPAEVFNLALSDIIDSNLISENWRGDIQNATEKAVDGAADYIVDKSAYLTDKMAEIGDEAGEALKDHVIDVQEQEMLRELVDAYIKAGGDASNEMVQAIINGDWGKLSEFARGLGEDFKKNLVGGAALDAKTVADLVSDPAALKASVVDVDRFWKGTLIPTLKNNAEDAKKALDSGQFTQAQVYENYIKPLQTLNDYLPGGSKRSTGCSRKVRSILRTTFGSSIR